MKAEAEKRKLNQSGTKKASMMLAFLKTVEITAGQT